MRPADPIEPTGAISRGTINGRNRNPRPARNLPGPVRPLQPRAPGALFPALSLLPPPGGDRRRPRPGRPGADRGQPRRRLDLDIVALSEHAHPTRPIHPLVAESWHFVNHVWGRYWVGCGIPLWTRGGVRYQYIDPYLREGGEHFPSLVSIYPEGGSSPFRDRRVLHRFFPGVARIAIHYRVPIVPAALVGFHRACPILFDIEKDHGPNDVVFPLCTFPVKLKIEFGEPFELSEFYGRAMTKDEEWRVANEVVRPRVAEVIRRHKPIDPA